jgi:hypothetical protein
METINQKYDYVRKNLLSAPPPTPNGIDAVMFALVKVGK